MTGAVVVLASWSERRRENHAEYYALLATAGAGMVFFVGAENLMTLFLGLEWFSLCLYILVAIDSERETSLEAGLKYLIVGGFGSAVLLFGSALVYGATSELSFPAIAAADASSDAFLYAGLAMILAGLAFKVSAAPFHMWTPDVYQGAPTSITGFMAAATKTAALVVTLRVLVTAFPEQEDLWTITVAVLAAISLVWGNLGALAQRDLKRILAYSSISHAGFMLMAIAAFSDRGAEALLYYLIPYSAMSVGAFAVVAARERELNAPVTLDSLAGMGWERPYHGIALWIFMLGMAGFPLTGGMFGKLFVFSAAYDAGDWWLVLLGVAATAVSLGYYLNVVRWLYMRSGAELRLAPAGGSPPRDPALSVAIAASVVVTVGSFFVVQPILDAAVRCGLVAPLLREESVRAIVKDRSAGRLRKEQDLESTSDRRDDRRREASRSPSEARWRSRASPPRRDTSKYPDLRAVVPDHLNLVNQQQNEYLRFSNGIANTGAGPWAMRPENELGSTPDDDGDPGDPLSNARYLCGTQPKPNDPCYTVLSEQAVSIFEYHPTHNHWHTADVARFEVRKGSPTGTVVGGNSIKVGFCLLDLYNLDGNAPTSEKVFWDCYTSYQGVSVGLGRPVPPGDRRPAGRPERAPERERLLPRLDDEPDRCVPRAVEDEQHRVGEVHALGATQREPQGDRHGALALREPRHVRRPLAEPLISEDRGRAVSPSGRAVLL